jgi:hypothetical protein
LSSENIAFEADLHRRFQDDPTFKRHFVAPLTTMTVSLTDEERTRLNESRRHSKLSSTGDEPAPSITTQVFPWVSGASLDSIARYPSTLSQENVGQLVEAITTALLRGFRIPDPLTSPLPAHGLLYDTYPQNIFIEKTESGAPLVRFIDPLIDTSFSPVADILLALNSSFAPLTPFINEGNKDLLIGKFIHGIVETTGTEGLSLILKEADQHWQTYLKVVRRSMQSSWSPLTIEFLPLSGVRPAYKFDYFLSRAASAGNDNSLAQ